MYAYDGLCGLCDGRSSGGGSGGGAFVLGDIGGGAVLFRGCECIGGIGSVQFGCVGGELQRVANRHSDASRQLEESLLQLNNELVETNDMIDHGRQLLGKGQHDLSQLRSHIGKLSRSCQQLKEATLSANGQATDQQVAL